MGWKDVLEVRDGVVNEIYIEIYKDHQVGRVAPSSNAGLKAAF